ncbi:MAG: GAF domain-containing protein [Candidatus Eremiobacteraeota bacterium]|nr:GAF domain-containing protein [Candidatus Eremiobacteraeota bacterium]
MTETSFRTPVDEARWLESSVLKARLLTIGIATLLFALLPWRYPMWLKAAIIIVWFAQGVVAATFVRRATTVEQILWSGRMLLAADTIVLAVPVLLYLPDMPEIWAALLIPVLWGGVRERLVGAIAVGSLASVVLLVAFAFHRVAPANEPQLARLLFAVSMVWLSVIAVRQLVRAVTMRNEALTSQREQLETAYRAQAEIRVRSENQASTLKKVTELAVSLLRERNLDALLDRMLDVTMQSFGFRAGAILVAERETESYLYSVVRGYPPQADQLLRKRRVPFALAELKMDKRFAIRPSVYYAPAERQTWYTDPEICYDSEHVNQRRLAQGAWHESDTLIFALHSSSGEVIGLLIPDAPSDGTIPSDDTVDNIALFARLAAAAIENVHIVTTEKSRANTLSEQNVEMKRLYADVEALAEERRLQADRLVRILELTAAIFRERDLKAMLHRILKVAVDTFGFAAGTILLHDPTRDVYVRHAAIGYPKGVEGGEVSSDEMLKDMTPATRVRDTFYYVPMELHHSGGVSRHPDRLELPRIQPGDWHENDLLIFPIFDSGGALIGVLSPDDPKDRRVPRDETIRTIEVFAQLAGMAVESARLREAIRGDITRSDVPA